jgi:peptide/nickel transport system substrate-binding protein
LPSLQFQGQASTATNSHPYTGSFTAEVVGEYTVDIICEQGCPIFPNTTMFLDFVAPNFLATATEDEQARTTVGLGPYQMVAWDATSIIQEAHDDYVPAGDHYEFQKPHIKNVKWLWRGESTVMAAMVKTGEADFAWDAGVDAIQALPEDMVRSGGTSKVWTVEMNTMWNPELKKVKVRQAMAHAVNCQELVDTLYAGYPACRGNITFPGVIGATVENTAPYIYDPAQSRQLLQEANYNPDTTLTYISRASRIPKQTEVNEAIQGYLKDVGITIEIKTVDPQIRNEYRQCQAGTALNEVLEASGRVPGEDQPTFDDFRAVLASGSTSCAYADLIENQPNPGLWPLAGQQLELRVPLLSELRPQPGRVPRDDALGSGRHR